jgi:hypothetical protein
MTAFDQFVTMLARREYEPDETDASRLLTDYVFLDWVETYAASNGAAQVLSDALEELSRNERETEMVLRAVVPGNMGLVSTVLRGKLWALCAKEAASKADAERFCEQGTGKFAEWLMDPVAADRRALARGSR